MVVSIFRHSVSILFYFRHALTISVLSSYELLCRSVDFFLVLG